MEVIWNLFERLKRLKTTEDPSEASALYDWVKQGGWKSLESVVTDHLKDVKDKVIKPVTLPVRRFDRWAKQVFEVYPYNTVEEVEKVIIESFGLKRTDARLQFLWEESMSRFEPISEIKRNETIAEIRKRSGAFKPDELQVIIMPANTGTKWYQENGKFTMPLLVVRSSAIPDWKSGVVDEKAIRTEVTLKMEAKGPDLVTELKEAFPTISLDSGIMFKREFINSQVEWRWRETIKHINVWYHWSHNGDFYPPRVIL